jgi:hypothetical protein
LALSPLSPPQAVSIEAMPSIAKAATQFFIPLVTVTFMDVSCSVDHRARENRPSPALHNQAKLVRPIKKLLTWPYRTLP